MNVTVHFYSYFKDLTGVSELARTANPGTTLGDLHEQLMQEFPKLRDMRKATLIAVGVEYQDRGYLLKEGDEVSLFPPVQGG